MEQNNALRYFIFTINLVIKFPPPQAVKVPPPRATDATIDAIFDLPPQAADVVARLDKIRNAVVDVKLRNGHN